MKADCFTFLAMISPFSMRYSSGACLGALVAALYLLPMRAGALEVGGGCGSIGGSFLYDYRPEKFKPGGGVTSTAQARKLLEDAHFTRVVETLQRGQSSRTPGGDISYLLQRMPNHYRALLSMVALGKKEGTPQPFESAYSIDCWFKRAVAFSPDDNTVRMLYAQYLFNASRTREAEYQLETASSQAGQNPFTHFNIGLIYFDAKNYARALAHARITYSIGFANLTLKEKLAEVGQWSEISPAKPEDAASNPD